MENDGEGNYVYPENNTDAQHTVNGKVKNQEVHLVFYNKNDEEVYKERVRNQIYDYKNWKFNRVVDLTTKNFGLSQAQLDSIAYVKIIMPGAYVTSDRGPQLDWGLGPREAVGYWYYINLDGYDGKSWDTIMEEDTYKWSENGWNRIWKNAYMYWVGPINNWNAVSSKGESIKWDDISTVQNTLGERQSWDYVNADPTTKLTYESEYINIQQYGTLYVLGYLGTAYQANKKSGEGASAMLSTLTVFYIGDQVIFDPNGGTINGETYTLTRRVKGDKTGFVEEATPDTNKIKPSSWTVAKLGQYFDGWYDGNSKVFDASGNPVKGSTCWDNNGKWIGGNGKILKARWTDRAIPSIFEVTINANGGTVSGTNPFTVTYGKNTGNDLNSYTITRDGYTFDGLWTSADGGICVWDSNKYAVRGQGSSTYWTGGEDEGYNNVWMGGSYTYWPTMTWNYQGNLTVYAHWKSNTSSCDHSTSSWVTTKTETCTEKGEKKRYCNICNYLLETKEIDELGHNPVKSGNYDATCTETGWKDRTVCSRCDTVTNAGSSIAALGHDYTKKSSEVHQSTSCTADGYKYYQCSRCDYNPKSSSHIYIYEYAWGHAWPSSYSYDTDNNIAKGKRYKNCERCSTRLETAYLISTSKGTGVSTVTDSYYEASGNSVSLSAKAEPGYTLADWSGYTTSSAFTMPDEAITMKANATPNNYTLYYNYNKPQTATSTMSGNSDTSKTVTYNNKVENLPSPSLPGWDFIGWKDSNGNPYTSDTVYKVVGDTTIYAQWEDKKAPTISVNPSSTTWVKSLNITITAKDDGSGLASSGNNYKYTFVPKGQSLPASPTWNSYTSGVATTNNGAGKTGEFTLYIPRIKDEAGNWSSSDDYHTFGTYQFDNTAPTITANSEYGWYTVDTELTFSASDSNSGMSSFSINGTAGTDYTIVSQSPTELKVKFTKEQSKKYTLTAKDEAGNVQTKEVTVNQDLDDFMCGY